LEGVRQTSYFSQTPSSSAHDVSSDIKISKETSGFAEKDTQATQQKRISETERTTAMF